jgi:crotonobetainyl-CoA:carnitine CoA-transferase CaiB-like acyl-CoA transferase
MGAEVIKIEQPDTGDTSRSHPNQGSTFYAYNRNKRSLALNLKTTEGKEIFRRLVEKSDVVIDNYAAGALSRLGIDYDWGSQVNPRIIYCSLKGFLPGPYGSRPFLDELAQMAGGLAYMTGPPGRPLRAGASIVDIGAATYGVVGILAAVYRRQVTGRGESIQSGLFETTVFWMNQHIARAQLSGKTPLPFAAGKDGMGSVMGWGVYQLFPTADGRDVFIAVTANRHWTKLCGVLGFSDWAEDTDFDSNTKRAQQGPMIADRIASVTKNYAFDELTRLLDEAEVPYAPVNTPSDLVQDPHLDGRGQWMPLDVPGHPDLKVPALPINMGETHFDVRRQPPRLGEHTDEILASVGYTPEEIDGLKEQQVVRRTDALLNVENP